MSCSHLTPCKETFAHASCREPRSDLVFGLIDLTASFRKVGFNFILVLEIVGDYCVDISEV
jgi:hypothetical protein